MSCASLLAKNIAPSCEHPLVGGYTGQAVIIPADDWAKGNIVISASNPRMIESIVLPVDGTVQVFDIDNVFATPFAGSTTAGNADSGRNEYLKTLAIRIPMRGADVSKDIVEPLVKNPDGFVVVVAKKNRVEDGGFEVLGHINSMRGDIASVTRDESANGGDWLVNLTTVEPYAEVTLVGSDGTYEGAKEVFDYLVNFEPSIVRFTSTGVTRLTARGEGNLIVFKDNVELESGVGEVSYSNTTSGGAGQYKIYGDIDYLLLDKEGDHAYDTEVISIDTSQSRAIDTLDLGGNLQLQMLNVKGLQATRLIMPDYTAAGVPSQISSVVMAFASVQVSVAIDETLLGIPPSDVVKVYYDASQQLLIDDLKASHPNWEYILVTE